MTITRWLQSAVLPEASVATQVTVVVPTGYGSVRGLPSERSLVTVTPGQSTLGDARSTVAERCPGPVVTVTSSGHENGIRTVTRKEQRALLPDLSVAVQVTVMVPTGKKEPDR